MEPIGNFYKSVDLDIEEASRLVSNLENYQRYEFDEEELSYDEKKQFDELLLHDYINKVILKIQFVLEYYELKEFLDSFNQKIAKYKGNYNQFDLIPYIDIFVNPVIGLLRDYVNAIACIIPDTEKGEPKNEIELSLLENFLKGTPKLIKDNNIIPSSEADVKRIVYNTLIHVFPDTIKEFPIPQEVTHYKPDFGVRHLKCGIEYKFVDSDEECKKFLGGIYEDMMAYEGTEDWTYFIAIIYMTDNYITQAQVDSQILSSKAKKNWKVFLVFGKGDREKVAVPKKARRSKSK